MKTTERTLQALRSHGGSFRVRLGMAVGIFVLYGFVFPFLYLWGGSEAVAFSAVPVASAGWFLGIAGGILAALTAFILNTWLLFNVGETSLAFPFLSQEGIYGTVVLFIIGGVTGWMHRNHYRGRQELLERLKVEQVLRAQEKRFRAVMENIVEVVALVDRTGRFLEQSPAAQNLLGYTPEALVGENAFDYIHPEDLSQTTEIFQILLDKPGGTVHTQLRFRHQDGTWRWLDATGANLLSEPGLEAIVLNYRDITEQVLVKESLQVRVAYQQSLLHLSRQLELTQSYTETMRPVFQEIETILGFHNIWVYLDAGNGDLQLMTSSGAISELAQTEFIPLSIKGDAFLEEVWQSREAVVVLDARTDPRTNKDIVAQLGNRTIINMPMLLHDNLLGFLGTGTFHEEGVRVLSQDQLDYLSSVANHLAVALFRIQLQETLEDRIRFTLLLNRITQTALETTQLADVGQKLVDQLTNLFDADVCYLTLWDESRRLPIPFAASGPMRESYPTIIPALERPTLTESALQAQHAIVVEDKFNTPYMAPQIAAEFPEQAALVLPLIAGEQKLGAVIVGYRQTRKFTTNETLRGEQAAAQMALAIAKTKWLNEAHHQANAFAMLYQTANVLTGQEELSDLLKIIVENAKTLLDAYAGGIYLYDPVKNELEVKVATDSSIPLGLRLAMGEGLAGQVAQTRQAMAVDDYQTWPFRSQKYENVRVRATAEVPLIYNAELIGVLVVHEFGESTRQFTQADLQLLSLFAAQSAGAIYNVRLLEAERHRRIEAETLREAASTLAASFDLHQILETLLAFLRRVVDYDSACVFLLEGKVIRAMAASGHPAPEKILGQSFPLDNDQLMPEIYQTGTPLILQDAQQDPRFLGWGGTEYIRGWMGIPLWARGQIIGILTVDSRQPGAYSPGEAALAQAFANQAAIALDNMQLLEAERRRRTEAETLYEATSALSVPLELSLVLENLLAALQRVVPYDSACVFFREGDFVRAMAAAGLPVPELVVNQRFPLANNYLQPEIYQTGQPIILEDAQLTDYFLKWGRTDYVRGWMGIPLWARGQIIGVLTVDSRQPGAYTPTEAALAQAFANQAGIAIDNARLLETERRRSEEADTLRQVMMAFIETFDLQEVLDQILTHLHRVIAYDQAHIGLLEGQHLRVVAQHGFRFPEQAKVHLSIDQFPHLQEAISQRIPVIISDTYTDPRWLSFPGVEHIRCWMGVPLIVKDRVIGLLNFDKTEAGSYTREHALLATTFAGQAAVAIENARLFEETIQRQSELEAVNRISKALRITSNMEAMFPILLQESSAILGVEAGVIWLYDPLSQKLHRKAASGWFAEIEEPEIQPGEGIAGQVFLSGESYQSQEFLTDPHTRALARSQVPDGWGGICVPLRAGQEVVGVFFISVPTTRQLTDQEVHLLHTVAEIAGSAMHRAQLHTMMQNQLQRLLALRSIDAAISASLDLRLILDLLLEHILSELHLDAACVLLATPQTYTLHFAAGRGFLTTAFQQVIIHFGEGLAGRVAADQAPLTVPDLRNLELYARSKMAQQEGFVFYTGVPLIAKGQVQGVLEVYQRSAFYAPPDWLDFLDALAAQAAIAINSAQLFADLQRSNTELMLAYDSTLEGWIGMLDMRDKETEGHTLRVMEMTVRLAQKLDLKDEQLIQLRRGALLHDIGKLAIPDRILLKTGPLNPDEWDAMRMHPQHAFNMLSRIPFLRPALDIPYCHHEKWDGTGYPRGLKGEQIPLAARIFSVVDVWDALTNDRPYRKAWPQDQARTYLLEQCGKYFDPKIPPVFLTLLDES